MEKIEQEIAKKIQMAGGELYLVGGALRDELLGRNVKDKDFCVVGITAEEFTRLFPEAYVRGKAFEVFDLHGNEYAIARKETKNGIGHKKFEIETNPNISIIDDLSRRDITINSIARNVITGEYIDPYNGKADLQNKVLRATTEKFIEDPLRIYRVARFAALLEFDVDEYTIKLMTKLKPELNALSAERVFGEFKKAIQARKPSIFFNILKKANVLEVHFKEINDLVDVLQPEKYHPEGDAYNHTMLVLDKAAELTDNIEVRFAALVHDLGKGVTPKEEYPHHYGHDEKGVELVAKLGKRLKMPNTWIKCGKISAKEHMRGGIFYKMKPAKQVDFIEKISKSTLGLNGMQIIVIADKTSSRNIDNENINFESLGNDVLYKITGEYVAQKYNLKPGIELGKKLREERIKYIKNIIY